MVHDRLGVLSLLSSTRRISAACGVVALLTLGLPQGREASNRLALVAFVAIGFAAALGWAQLLIRGRPPAEVPYRIADPSTRRWLLAASGVVVAACLAVQTWFRPGTTIAGGDATPPVGTAWVERLFEPWVWTGSNLGQPSELALQLPWAAVLGTVHLMGGGPEVAQRIWFTALFIGAGLAALSLLATLRLGPGAALVGTAAYIFNPYVVNAVGTSPVAIAALGLLAAMPAAILAASTGQLQPRLSVALMVVAVPLFGYVDLNPPLLGMVLGTMVATPLVAGWVFGKEAALRGLRTLLLAVPLILAVSLYWVIPAMLYLSVVPSDSLAAFASWSWTETRATIGNAFWLNTNWGWNFPEYYPFAGAYDALPLSLIRFVLPALAFSALALGPARSRRRHSFVDRDRALRLAVAAATGATMIIFLSTGTNPPGNIVFDALYQMPLGWLLREPGRFLMLVSLTYAVLIAVVVDALHSHRSMMGLRGLRHASAQTLRFGAAPLGLIASFSLGFPIYTGLLVPDTRPSLPSAHVKVPDYWPEMAQFVDSLPIQGGVLIMPPDDFYQMPYMWGYYGTDEFMVDLLHRPVLVSSGQGYSPASSEVASAIQLTSQSILSHDWRQTQALAMALDTPLILVRGDIDTSLPGRTIQPPNAIALALNEAPNFVLSRTIGPLELFALKAPTADSERLDPVMTDSQGPDLRILSILAPHAALVSGTRQIGLPYVSSSPPVETWQDIGDSLVWRTKLSPGWRYQMAEANSHAIVSLDHPTSFTFVPSGAQAAYSADDAGGAVTVSIKGRQVISDGDFSGGPWGPVGDCNDVQALAHLSADIVPKGAPGGLPSLRLTAPVDSACTSQQLNWRGGSLVLSLMIHSVQGSPPRLCLWEIGPQRCASVPSVTNAVGWTTYRAAATPDPGTTAMDLVLYADANGGPTINEYADVSVLELPVLPTYVLLGNPEALATSSLQLVVLHNSFSPYWGATNGKHVLVDGMLNGWLVEAGAPFKPAYVPESSLRAAQVASVASLLATLAVVVLLTIRHRRRNHLYRPPARR